MGKLSRFQLPFSFISFTKNLNFPQTQDSSTTDIEEMEKFVMKRLVSFLNDLKIIVEVLWSEK